MNENRRPKVGVGVFVQRGEEVLLGLRKGSHGAGTWSIPGGLIEADENVSKAAIRELAEETGIAAKYMTALVAPATLRGFDKSGGSQSYVTLYAHVHIPDTCQAKITEPDKCAEWRWVSMMSPEWPGPLFECLDDLFKAEKIRSPYELMCWLSQAKRSRE